MAKVHSQQPLIQVRCSASSPELMGEGLVKDQNAHSLMVTCCSSNLSTELLKKGDISTVTSGGPNLLSKGAQQIILFSIALPPSASNV